MHDRELKSLFEKISSEKPSGQHLRRLREYTDRRKVIDFLVDRLKAFIAMSDASGEWDGDLEWGAIHACGLLGEFKAEKAAEPMVEILDSVKDNYMTILYNAAMNALEEMGLPALEPAYRKYQQDRDNPERASTWLWVLARLGVKDERIHHGLLDHLLVDRAEAVNLMADYGDRDCLPIMEEYVYETARYLNDNQIDPFAPFGMFEDPLVINYIDTRESLVMLKEGITIDHPEFDEKVEALDRQLLRYADFSAYEEHTSVVELPKKSRKIGRNEPCPCGSGRKYKNCCGRL